MSTFSKLELTLSVYMQSVALLPLLLLKPVLKSPLKVWLNSIKFKCSSIITEIDRYEHVLINIVPLWLKFIIVLYWPDMTRQMSAHKIHVSIRVFPILYWCKKHLKCSANLTRFNLISRRKCIYTTRQKFEIDLDISFRLWFFCVAWIGVAIAIWIWGTNLAFKLLLMLNRLCRLAVMLSWHYVALNDMTLSPLATN